MASCTLVPGASLLNAVEDLRHPPDWAGIGRGSLATPGRAVDPMTMGCVRVPGRDTIQIRTWPYGHKYK